MLFEDDFNDGNADGWFECCLDTLRAKVWTGGSGAEPTDWMIVQFDGNYQNNGCMSLEGINYFNNDLCVEFDNIVVTSVPVSLDHNTWGAIKAHSDRF